MVLHDDMRGQMYAHIFNYQLWYWTIRYLGAPVCDCRVHVTNWVPADEKITKNWMDESPELHPLVVG